MRRARRRPARIWTVNGIYVIGPDWHPNDRRLEALARLPKDVAGLLIAAKSHPDPDKCLLALRRHDDADQAYVDEFIDCILDEMDLEDARDAVPAFGMMH